jgi:hypothetical protein
MEMKLSLIPSIIMLSFISGKPGTVAKICFQITPLLIVRIILLILFQVSHWLIQFIITRLTKVISSGVKNYSLRQKFAHNVVRSQYCYHLAAAGGVLLQVRKIPTLLQVSLHHISELLSGI